MCVAFKQIQLKSMSNIEIFRTGRNEILRIQMIFGFANLMAAIMPKTIVWQNPDFGP